MCRMGTNLKCGIVGLPNVGKSTFFNVLTKSSMAAAENFPFCTIDPNEVRNGEVLNFTKCLQARVPVPDSRFDFLVAHHKPVSKVGGEAGDLGGRRSSSGGSRM